MKKKRMIISVFILTIISAFGLFNIFNRNDFRDQAQAAPDPQGPVPAKVSAILPELQASFSSGLHENGTIEAVDRVVLKSKISGRMDRMLIRQGDRVTAGQPVAVIEHDAIAASLAVATAELAVAKAQLSESQVALTDAQREADRYDKLFKDGYCTEQQLTQRLTALASEKACVTTAMATVQKHQANIREIKVDLNDATITAPFDGIIADDFSHVRGEMIGIDTAIVELIDPDNLYARICVAEQDTRRIITGMPAKIEILGGGQGHFTGKVWRIQPVVETATRTTRVDVLIDRPEQMRPGMFAKVFFIENRATNVAVLPKTAVNNENESPFIWIAEGENARRRPVTLGPEDGSRISILTPLSDDTRILVTGTRHLSDGDPVEITNMDQVF